VEKNHAQENLGEVLRGDRIVKSPIKVRKGSLY